MDKKALVLIEFQKEWLAEDGKLNRLLEDRTQFESAVTAAEQVLQAVRGAEDWEVIHVGLAFSDGYPELGETDFGLRGAIRRAGTFPRNGSGSRFGDAFQPVPGEFVVSGRMGASGFSGSNLDGYLRNNRIGQLYLMGFALHVCVESTLRHGHDLGYEVTVVEDAAAAFNQRQRKHVLEDVVHHFGQSISAQALIQGLAARG